MAPCPYCGAQVEDGATCSCRYQQQYGGQYDQQPSQYGGQYDQQPSQYDRQYYQQPSQYGQQQSQQYGDPYGGQPSQYGDQYGQQQSQQYGDQYGQQPSQYGGQYGGRPQQYGDPYGGQPSQQTGQQTGQQEQRPSQQSSQQSSPQPATGQKLSAPGKILIRIAGLLMIIFGAAGLGSGSAHLSLFSTAIDDMVVYWSYFEMLVSAVMLAFGIIATLLEPKKERAGMFMIFGIALLALAVISIIWAVAFFSEAFNFLLELYLMQFDFNAAAGIILSALMFLGAIKRKKASA